MNQEKPTCCYHEDEGFSCHEVAEPSGLCYWHDPRIIKNKPDDKVRLEAFARTGGMLRGISLKRANLSGIDLVKHHSKTGFDMTHAELYRANLQGAHMFNLNLEHASLMKADLRDANVHCANLTNTNLLGVKWKGTKIENIYTGKQIKQERMAREADKLGEVEIALDYYEQSEEIYRDLRKAADREGLFAMAGHFMRKELIMRRHQMPKWSSTRIISKSIDLFCGYGEAPLRVIGFSMVLIFFCALCYFFTGLSYSNQIHQFNFSNNFEQNINLLLNCIYYSVVTFTTLGYGDFIPIGYSKAVAAIEAFTGSFTIALFVVVFVKKMNR
ncbi:pentapeptide repeat-containing protein [Shewanella holmiensis]|uniref:Pentapeptide repeat-containing protein n=1 Tax=Shewanella holmiensis TaxID=2952222 RepID=A0A9X2WJX8_9GAMM|nr:pentapeptide repeat-containing protein [Shewanella holmiensis]MCT7940776.1 pentapeptide repeat-containing protein [Shewanella holmiensis]